MKKEKTYLILSGDGEYGIEHQVLMACESIDEANEYFDSFKTGAFAETYLYIYEAKLIREE